MASGRGRGDRGWEAFFSAVARDGGLGVKMGEGGQLGGHVGGSKSCKENSCLGGQNLGLGYGVERGKHTTFLE